MQSIPKISLLSSENLDNSNTSEKTDAQAKYEVLEYTEADAESAALEWCVDHLEQSGGDLDRFCKSLRGPTENAIFQIERRLNRLKEPHLRERWDTAIQLFQITRMKLLQRNAVDRLENLDAANEKESRIVIAFAKLVLGDLLTASAALSKQKALTKSEKNSVLSNVIEDMDADGEEE